jgi:hypothetical protein
MCACSFPYLVNNLPISAKAFISTALPLGSLKNIVACSPGSPWKRIQGAMTKSMAGAVSLLADACQVSIGKTIPK